MGGVVEDTLPGGQAAGRPSGVSDGALPADDPAAGMTAMRLVHAAAELVCEEGLPAATVPRVAALAGSSPEGFLQVFPSLEDCLRLGCAQCVIRAAGRARRRAAGSTDARPHAALDGLLEFVEQESELAGLCTAVLLAPSASTVFSCGSLSARDRLALGTLEPALSLVGRTLSEAASEPTRDGQRASVPAGLVSEAQSMRLVRCLASLGLVLAGASDAIASVTEDGQRLCGLLLAGPAPSR
jgi:AcrR family transcriptional regulator